MPNKYFDNYIRISNLKQQLIIKSKLYSLTMVKFNMVIINQYACMLRSNNVMI